LVKVCLICIFSSNIVKQIFFRLLPFNIQCMSYYTFKCNYYSNFTSLRRKMWFYWIYCHWQTFSHNVVSSTSCLSRIRTHVSGHRHWLHK
jgi:hypothetical protein